MSHSLQIHIARAALLVAVACLVGTVAIAVVKIRTAEPRDETTIGAQGPPRTTAKSP